MELVVRNKSLLPNGFFESLRRVKRWHVIQALIEEHGWKKGAEIGVLNGATFFYLLDNSTDLSMIGVDIWGEEDPFYGDLRGTGKEVREKAESYGDRVTILHGASAEMVSMVENRSLDFCFIDADHSKNAVVADLQAWLPKVRDGGAMLGHDIDLQSVQDGIEAVLGMEKLHVLPDDVWGFAIGWIGSEE